ncbi:MAG: thioredoxin domain-containing protein [Pseudomonadota bacterium]
MFGINRRSLLSALMVASLAACGSGGDEPAEQISQDDEVAAEIGQDMVLGDPDAPITLVEYASWTCGACWQFHNDVMPMLEEEYIETGKVRLVFREFPTAPVNVSLAGFVMARCRGADQYFEVIDELFDRQSAILALVRNGGAVRDALVQIGLNQGLADEAAFDACLADEAHRRNIATAVGRGEAQGVNSTPTVFMNGVRLPGSNWRVADGMRVVLDEALAEIEGTGAALDAAEGLGETAESADTGSSE